MTMQEITQYVKTCGELLYQNREQEAYQLLQKLIGLLNQVFQHLVMNLQTENREYVLAIVGEFLTAYQLNDNLALADLLYYDIPEILNIESV